MKRDIAIGPPRRRERKLKASRELCIWVDVDRPDFQGAVRQGEGELSFGQVGRLSRGL